MSKRCISTVFGFVLLAAFGVFCVLPTSSTAATQEDADASVEDLVELRNKIGQMIMVGFLGDSPKAGGFQKVRQQLQSGAIGGVLYLGRNLRNQETVRRMNGELRAASPSRLPVLIAIDQEGGVVQRLKRHHGFPHTLSAKQIAKQSSLADAAEIYGVLAGGLAEWGFTLNLGPVVDVDVNPRNPIIGRLGRSYSRDPGRVAAYGGAFVEAHRKHGVLTALKHFPGHGSSRRDSHKGAVDVSRSWSEKELEPFRNLIVEDRADIIMTAHVINRKLQGKGERGPVSLSKGVLSRVLREDLGFGGVIMSDDLQMDAIRRNHSLKDAIVKAVAAGTDIILFANDKRPDPNIPAKVADILLEASAKDPELAQKIAAAHDRIVALKARLGSVPKVALASSGDLEAWLSEIAPDPDRCTLEYVQ
ncbi:glycoside hydrolase family 3 N-terminal domain-containing protein [uncultured Roseibium sp.]|uniref:glycoside hydrolase family 3 protein n=1 Tax=uncultured Roseibium sp. TaxID=1936171 RepID=UPI0026096FC4|nr:glycoside hydrolase family 3 N-terminal domain-containing protein [uncultured Roseibium sp.]